MVTCLPIIVKPFQCLLTVSSCGIIRLALVLHLHVCNSSPSVYTRGLTAFNYHAITTRRGRDGLSIDVQEQYGVQVPEIYALYGGSKIPQSLHV